MPEQGEYDNNRNNKFEKRIDAVYLNALHSNPAWNFASMMTQTTAPGDSGEISCLIVEIKKQSLVMYKHLLKNYINVMCSSEYDYTARKFLFFNLLLHLQYDENEIVSDIFNNLNEEGKKIAGDLYLEWQEKNSDLFYNTKRQEEIYALKKQKDTVIIGDELYGMDLSSYLNKRNSND